MFKSQMQRERKRGLVLVRAEREIVDLVVGGRGAACRSCCMAGERARSRQKSSKSVGARRACELVVGAEIDAAAFGVLRSGLPARLAGSGAQPGSLRGLDAVGFVGFAALLVRLLIVIGESGELVLFRCACASVGTGRAERGCFENGIAMRFVVRGRTQYRRSGVERRRVERKVAEA